MALFKVTYQVNGDPTFRDVNVSSDKELTTFDDEVIQAAMRDSVHYTPASSATSINGLRVVMVTPIK
ncbi:hypothetical protein SJ093_11060 [Citrobacter freundii]|uniref:hypothetical protein n=1 Tax=Enterobacteriaceae TaxID=543 RepID=UPI0010053314|nr:MULTISPECIES: hypothetical protein [Enterobacteriaceae]EKK5566470.1 hypothetical protein [Enterobacter hormaechei]MCT4734342.1 hypothetical protein [Citrobacter freundii]MDT7134286.1 hypothetical protein [Citrobacter freundii]MDT7265250.1 hypothetical protein [Citrobacter freundii]MDT7275288.1 hypothetical protein [Citrobacter freundii]